MIAMTERAELMSTTRPSAWLRLGRHRGLILAIVVFAVLLAVINFVSAAPLAYYDLSQMATNGATLALAAAGQTLVIISGGFDLSAGAVVSLTNVVLARYMPDYPMAGPAWIAVGVGVGCLSGAFNGLFIAVLRMQPIVVTLSTMFILQGLTLLVLDKPGGAVDVGLSEMFIGDAVPDVLPIPVLLLVILLVLWLWLKHSRFGTALYAVGSDPDAARAAGVRTRLTVFVTYVLAGGCYGLAGVFISAQTGSGDPLVGNPMLLQIFAAVVLGGTLLGGGRGGLLGSVIGAYILMMVVNILLVLNVSAYFSTIAEGTILVLAVLGASVTRHSPLAASLRLALRRLRARRAGLLPSQRREAAPRLVLPARGARDAAKVFQRPSFVARHAETLRYALPAYVAFAAVLIATELVLGRTLTSVGYYDSLIVLSVFLAILALGQGTVILTGGLDLSVPWTIGLCGILLAGLVKGSDAALVYALPLVLAIGCLIGFLNGLGIVALGISPIVMTLATNGILQGLSLIYSNGTPDGFSSPLLRDFMTARSLGVTPVVPFIALFVIGGVLLLGRTPFGRRVYGIGNGERVAALSGIAVGPTIVKVYVLSGLCSALVGVLLTGFSGQASLGMGDDYLLPSIAVVVVGGALITGGRGHYLGMLGGVLLLTALQTLLAGTTLPYAIRAILFGLVVLGAVLALRDRRT
jgi:ribose transport system permease protein